MTLETDQQIGEITTILDTYPEGLPRGQISDKLSFSINDKTLQRRLAMLVSDGRISKTGVKKATIYYPVLETVKGQKNDGLASIFSPPSQKSIKFLENPLYEREKVSYNREFLNSYVPNVSIYVPEKVRATLLKRENVSMSNWQQAPMHSRFPKGS